MLLLCSALLCRAVLCCGARNVVISAPKQATDSIIVISVSTASSRWQHCSIKFPIALSVPPRGQVSARRLGGVMGMTESALSARLKLQRRAPAPWKGVWGKPSREGTDDGKRAYSAIEVAWHSASPYGRGSGGNHCWGVRIYRLKLICTLL